MKGYFVSFEGPDGAGKSTVLKEVLDKIGPKLKPQYLVTREPGGSKIAEKIRQALAIPYILNPAYDLEKEQYVEHSCSASIGILVFDSHEKSQDDLLKRADLAMYKAKEQGKNAIAFYE